MENQHEGCLQDFGHFAIFQGWNSRNYNKPDPAMDQCNEQEIHYRTLTMKNPSNWNEV